MIPADVVVIGGGGQGLWLLNDLTRRGYRAILLERTALGAGQTTHAHALIHRGHYYTDLDMITLLNASAQFWEGFARRNGIRKLNEEPAVVGFGPGIEVAQHTYRWDWAGLDFAPLQTVPDVFRNGSGRYFFTTKEFSLDANQVVRVLAKEVRHAIYALDPGPASLEMHVDDGRVSALDALVGGVRHSISPRAVVFAAGAGNLDLMRSIGRDLDHARGGIPFQAQRKSHMLLLRGELPPVTAVFPVESGLKGLFICSRRDPETGSLVWLVSNHLSTPHGPGSEIEPSAEVLQDILVDLVGLAPGALERASDLEASIYTVLTAERNLGEGTHMADCFVERPGLENVLAIWPTKLTLVPIASEIAIRFLGQMFPDPAGPWPQAGRPIQGINPPVVDEMWKRAPFSSPTEVKRGWSPFDDFVSEMGVVLP